MIPSASPRQTVEFSVAMCTYNGQKYLRQQLDSINAQSLLPAELVICDDGSTDSTLDIIQDFCGSAKFDVRVQRNECTLKVAKNFEKAIGLCKGEVVVLCDQDDVWTPRRLEAVAPFYMDRDCMSVLNNGTMVDEGLEPLGYDLWSSVGLVGRDLSLVRKGRPFEVLLRHDFVTGAAFSFRSELKDMFTPIPSPWLHDEWAAMMLAARSTISLCPEELFQYRQHSSQQVGAKKRSMGAQLSDSVKFTKEDREFFEKKYRIVREVLASSEGVDPAHLRALDGKLAHMKARSDMMDPNGRKLVPVLREVLNGNYRRYSNGIKSAARDLFF